MNSKKLSRFCLEIFRANLDVPEERKAWVDRGGKHECALLCGKAARLLFEIIEGRERKTS
jgi:hypothetical protein